MPRVTVAVWVVGVALVLLTVDGAMLPYDPEDIRIWPGADKPIPEPPIHYTVTGSEKFMQKQAHWSSPVVDHNARLVLCSIPKCGSTPLRQLFRRMQPKHGNYLDRTGAHYWVHNKMPHFDQMTPEEVNAVLANRTYRKIAVVRHPVERLVSAFKDKILGSGYNGEENWGKRYYKNENMSFSEFVDHVTKERACDEPFVNGRKFSGLNEHWQCLYCFCGLDVLRNNFEIYRLESVPELVHDLVLSQHVPEEVVSSGFGRDGTESFFKYRELGPTGRAQTEAKTAALLHKYYTPELLDIVKRRYKKDFDFFGIDPDEYDDAILNGHP
eukprot:m.33239 g.33239  ORF g.33239 m.33239 type:complete len:326 (-) comp10327_c0_seq1:70-1047(-)